MSDRKVSMKPSDKDESVNEMYTRNLENKSEGEEIQTKIFKGLKFIRRALVRTPSVPSTGTIKSVTPSNDDSITLTVRSEYPKLPSEEIDTDYLTKDFTVQLNSDTDLTDLQYIMDKVGVDMPKDLEGEEISITPDVGQMNYSAGHREYDFNIHSKPRNPVEKIGNCATRIVTKTKSIERAAQTSDKGLGTWNFNRNLPLLFMFLSAILTGVFFILSAGLPYAITLIFLFTNMILYSFIVIYTFTISVFELLIKRPSERSYIQSIMQK